MCIRDRDDPGLFLFYCLRGPWPGHMLLLPEMCIRDRYNTLKDWGMQMLVGTVTSTPCTAVVEESHADNMLSLIHIFPH